MRSNFQTAILIFERMEMCECWRNPSLNIHHVICPALFFTVAVQWLVPFFLLLFLLLLVLFLFVFCFCSCTHSSFYCQDIVNSVRHCFLSRTILQWSLVWWVECSPMMPGIESYQKLQKWYSMPSCLALTTIRQG